MQPSQLAPAARRDAGQARFDAMLAVADDATEAAETLGVLMGGARGAGAAEPPRKRQKTEDASPVRPPGRPRLPSPAAPCCAWSST